MIRRLHIEGWRAFEHLDLELDEGVTFVIAENGVGKTSLIQAASWGLYGPLSGIDPGKALRFGEGRAIVEVDLELPGRRLLTIERSFTNCAQSVHAKLDGIVVDQTELSDVITDAFGASQDFLSRTTLLTTADVADDTAGVFQLHNHLCHAFGVDTLQNVATQLRNAHAAAAKEAAKQRQQIRRAAEDLDQLRNQLADLEQAVAIAEQAQAESRDAVQAAEHHVDQARTAHAGRQQAAADQVEFEELQTAAHAFLALTSPDATVSPAAPEASAVGLRKQLAEAEAEAARVADGCRTDLAIVEARLSVAQTGIAELHNAAAECPVCRRQLSSDDRETAEHRHQQDLTDLTDRQTSLKAKLDAATHKLQDVRALAGRAARLPVPTPQTGTTEPNVADATQQLDQARAAHEEHRNQTADIRAERNNLQRRITEEQTAATQAQQAYLAHRREAAANIATQIMDGTAEAILTQRIDPLATEITNRWKRVFVNRGELRLRHDGRLVLRRGTHEIGFDQLSSGEKVIALLAMRLLVLSSSTRASFLWLDEPLEHLDPATGDWPPHSWPQPATTPANYLSQHTRKA